MRGRSHTLPDVARILVVDDHQPARDSIADVLRAAGHQVHGCSSGRQALNWLEQQEVEVILTDLQMPGMSGLELIRALQQAKTDAHLVMITAHGTVAAAVEAMRLGAFDFIEKPFDAGELEQIVQRALTGDCAVRRVAREPRASSGDELIGSSTAMRMLKNQIDRLAPIDETVLIVGESGTGKELVARALHRQSPRAAQPLVGLNCPALSPSLMESELFGHEKGAFTGAESRRVGRFELAQHGTILLDEITEIELALQAKLLRVLQERTYERVGASGSVNADVRVLATTNRDLAHEVAEGRFRQDLYYRLAVVPLEVPPLRRRKEDVAELVEHFLVQAAGRLQRDPVVVGDDAMALLHDYHWPGNVRELENLMKRVTVLHDRALLRADDLRPWLMGTPSPEPRPACVAAGVSLQEMERQLIEATLERFGGHREKTAQALGIGVRTLANKLRAYGYPPRAHFQERIPAIVR